MLLSFKKMCVFLNKDLVSRLNRDDLIAGTLYMLTALFMGMLGGLIPLSLSLFPSQGSHYLATLLSVHPLLMQYYCVVPALICGLSTLFLPCALERPGMLLGRANCVAAVVVALCGAFTILFPGQPMMVFPWGVAMIVAAMSILTTAFDSCADFKKRCPFSFFVWGEVFSAAVLLVALPLFLGRLFHALLFEGVSLTVYGRDFLFPCDTVALLCGFGLVFGFVKRTMTPLMSLLVIGSMAAVASCNTIAWGRTLLENPKAAVAMESFYGAAHLLSLCSMVFFCLLTGVWLASVWHRHVKPSVPVLWGIGFLAVIALGWFCYFSHYPVLHSMVQISALFAVCDGFYIWRDNTHFWYSKKGGLLQFALTSLATVSLLVPLPSMLMMSRLLFAASAVVFMFVVITSLTSNKRNAYLRLVHTTS